MQTGSAVYASGVVHEGGTTAMLFFSNHPHQLSLNPKACEVTVVQLLISHRKP